MREDTNNKITQYAVPANVATKFELLPGFGWGEAKFVLVALIIGTALFFLTGLFMKTSLIAFDDLNYKQSIGFEEGLFILNDDGLVEVEENAISTIARIFFIGVPGLMSFYFVKRDPSSNMSLIYSVRSAIEFKKKQRLYIYKYNSGTEV